MVEMIFPGALAEEALARRLNLPWDRRMQDWALEVSDANRLDEFISVIQTEQLSKSERVALMELILASAEDAELEGRLKPSSWAQVKSELLAQPKIFVGHVKHWAMLDENTEDVFPITAHMREVWAEMKKRDS